MSKTDEWTPVTPAPGEVGRPVAGRRPVPAPSGSGRASAAGRSGKGRPPRRAAALAVWRSHLIRRRATAGLVLLVLLVLMWHASLTSLSLLILLLLAAVALAAGVGWAWGRWPARWALCGRALSLLLIAAMGSVISLDALNRSENFYASLGDLLGQSPSTTSAPSTQVAASRSRLTVLTPGWASLGVRQAAAGRGTLIDVDIRGAASGIDRRALVDLPPEFFLAPSLRLPAVEMLPGWPGGPVNITGKLDAGRLLDQERQTYRMPPVVAVLPTASAGASSECVDAVGGQRNGTYLADDVPQAVTAAFRVLPGASWATIGYSTGGFCAANLALHHADRYVAGASLSGYFTAAQDPNTGRLYGHSTSLLHRNSPTWLIGHTHLSGPPLFVMASRGDPDAVREQHALLTAARSGNPTFPLTATLLPAGGHNWTTWKHALPAALDWLGAYLPKPSSAPLELPLAPAGGVPLPAAHPPRRTRPIPLHLQLPPLPSEPGSPTARRPAAPKRSPAPPRTPQSAAPATPKPAGNQPAPPTGTHSPAPKARPTPHPRPGSVG